MGRFAQYLGKLEVNVNGNQLELDARLKDKKKFMATGDMQDTEKKVDIITEVLMDIMKRSYPEEPVEEIEAFIDKNYNEYLEALLIAFKWAKKEDFDKVKKKIEEN